MWPTGSLAYRTHTEQDAPRQTACHVPSTSGGALCFSQRETAALYEFPKGGRTNPELKSFLTFVRCGVSVQPM